MDCLEFRRQLGSDPQARLEGMRVHRERCGGCAQAQSLALAFESRLAQALAVPVPHDLADRILLAQLTGVRQQRRRLRRRSGWVALAAAAVLALAVGLVQRQAVPTDLADLVARHVNGHERSALALRTPVPPQEVADAFAARGVHLGWVPQGVSYVRDCAVGPWRSVHMVVPAGDVPVSVLYVLGGADRTRHEFQRDALLGRVVPVADGSLVMAATTRAPFDAIERRWRDAIEGPPRIAAGSR